jgi:hypothetical protein
MYTNIQARPTKPSNYRQGSRALLALWLSPQPILTLWIGKNGRVRPSGYSLYRSQRHHSMTAGKVDVCCTGDWKSQCQDVDRQGQSSVIMASVREVGRQGKTNLTRNPSAKNTNLCYASSRVTGYTTRRWRVAISVITECDYYYHLHTRTLSICKAGPRQVSSVLKHSFGASNSLFPPFTDSDLGIKGHLLDLSGYGIWLSWFIRLQIKHGR